MPASSIRRKVIREFEKLAKTKTAFDELDTGMSFNMLYNMDDHRMSDLIKALKDIQKATRGRVEPSNEYSQSDNNKICELMAPYAYRPDMKEEKKTTPLTNLMISVSGENAAQVSGDLKTILPPNETDAMLPVVMPLVDDKVGYCGMCNRLNLTADQVKDRVELANADTAAEATKKAIIKKRNAKKVMKLRKNVSRVKQVTREQMNDWLSAESRVLRQNAEVHAVGNDILNEFLEDDESTVTRVERITQPGDHEKYEELKQFRKDIASQKAKKKQRERENQIKEYNAGFEKYGMKPPKVNDYGEFKLKPQTNAEVNAYRAECQAKAATMSLLRKRRVRCCCLMTYINFI